MKAVSQNISLGHGSGGRLTRDFIREFLLKEFNNPILNELADSARIPYKEQLAFTTDSFVVNPLFFPGGDIGKLAVCGTVNDLVMLGAAPEYLSLAMIIEEGLPLATIKKVASSISRAAKEAGVEFVTGDLKVVEKGACDKLFITTSGIGKIVSLSKISIFEISPGDKIIVTGGIGEHGLAVLSVRKDIDIGVSVRSDCAPLNNLLLPLIKKTGAVRFMRDPTRGGLATTLNEIAESSNLGIVVEEKDIPVSSKVRAAGELLGIDPLYISNEGKAILVVKKDKVEAVLRLLRSHPLGSKARCIGSVEKSPKAKVVLNTVVGTERILDMLTSDPLPRIC